MDNIQKLTVYLGSSGRCRTVFKDSARRLGHLIGEHHKTLVYGGMDAGLMGIVANNALQSGATVTGIIPKKLKDSERIHPNLTETILVPDLWERKLKMFKRADAIIGLPGGFGTIDELLEALYWAKIGSHAKPVVLVNTEGYWNEFLSYIHALPDLPAGHLLVVDTVDNIFDALADWNAPKIDGDMDKLPHFEDIILEDTAAPITFQTASVEQSYYLATALGLKQLGRHDRHIGLLNDQGQFDALIEWINHAKAEHFITDRCTLLFTVASNEADLYEKLDKQPTIHIDLQHEKWGPSETQSHIELKETE